MYSNSPHVNKNFGFRKKENFIDFLFYDYHIKFDKKKLSWDGVKERVYVICWVNDLDIEDLSSLK